MKGKALPIIWFTLLVAAAAKYGPKRSQQPGTPTWSPPGFLRAQELELSLTAISDIRKELGW